MPEVNIIAIIHPASGKTARLKELLAGMCKDVHEKEDYTLRYLMTEQLKAEEGKEPDIVMIETYKSKEGADKHNKEPHFKQLFSTAGDEGLFGASPYIVQTSTQAGFDLDHKLL